MPINTKLGHSHGKWKREFLNLAFKNCLLMTGILLRLNQLILYISFGSELSRVQFGHSYQIYVSFSNKIILNPLKTRIKMFIIIQFSKPPVLNIFLLLAYKKGREKLSCKYLEQCDNIQQNH